MKFRLTDREQCVLGWDDPALMREDPEIAQLARKCDGRCELDKDDIALLADCINQLATFGADPQDTAAAKRLRRKVGLLVQSYRKVFADLTHASSGKV